MSNQKGDRSQPEEHFVQKRHRWPALKILLIFVAVLAVFGAGYGIGHGDIHGGGQSAGANSLNYSSVNQLYSLLQKDFDGNLNQTKLLDGIKTGLVSATGDPYTEYFNAADAKTLNSELAGTIDGIGAKLGTDTNGDIIIMSPLPNTPAAKAGLQPKDIITAINGKSTQGLSADTAATKIRGPAGTKVTLTIVRDGGNPFDVPITRQQITVPSVNWSEDGNIGYLQISQFTQDAGAQSLKAAQEFKSKGVKAVILDLRGDPGGYLDQAVDVSSLWLKQGQTVVSERRGSTIEDTQYANGNNPLLGLPTIVLIDGGSASASEITAGALHDNNAAQLVGVTSFGKGSVQQVENLSGGGELKVTIAHWYTPDGKNINLQGIKPDVQVANPANAAQTGQDPQKDKAIQILQAKING